MRSPLLHDNGRCACRLQRATVYCQLTETLSGERDGQILIGLDSWRTGRRSGGHLSGYARSLTLTSHRGGPGCLNTELTSISRVLRVSHRCRVVPCLVKPEQLPERGLNEHACSRRPNATSSTVRPSAFCAPAAAASVRRTGGTPTISSGRPAWSRRIAPSSTAVTVQPTSGLIPTGRSMPSTSSGSPRRRATVR